MRMCFKSFSIHEDDYNTLRANSAALGVGISRIVREGLNRVFDDNGLPLLSTSYRNLKLGKRGEHAQAETPAEVSSPVETPPDAPSVAEMMEEAVEVKKAVEDG